MLKFPNNCFRCLNVQVTTFLVVLGVFTACSLDKQGLGDDKAQRSMSVGEQQLLFAHRGLDGEEVNRLWVKAEASGDLSLHYDGPEVNMFWRKSTDEPVNYVPFSPENVRLVRLCEKPEALRQLPLDQGSITFVAEIKDPTLNRPVITLLRLHPYDRVNLDPLDGSFRPGLTHMLTDIGVPSRVSGVDRASHATTKGNLPEVRVFPVKLNRSNQPMFPAGSNGFGSREGELIGTSHNLPLITRYLPGGGPQSPAGADFGTQATDDAAATRAAPDKYAAFCEGYNDTLVSAWRIPQGTGWEFFPAAVATDAPSQSPSITRVGTSLCDLIANKAQPPETILFQDQMTLLRSNHQFAPGCHEDSRDRFVKAYIDPSSRHLSVVYLRKDAIEELSSDEHQQASRGSEVTLPVAPLRDHPPAAGIVACTELHPRQQGSNWALAGKNSRTALYELTKIDNAEGGVDKIWQFSLVDVGDDDSIVVSKVVLGNPEGERHWFDEPMHTNLIVRTWPQPGREGETLQLPCELTLPD